jgi:hypothetical protein
MDFTLPTTLLGWIGAGIAAIATALTAFGGRSLFGILREHLKNVAFDKLRAWAATYVRSLAQSPDLEGLATEEKKERAMVWIVNKAEQLGVEIAPQEASHLIEEEVWLIKNVGLPAVADALD